MGMQNFHLLLEIELRTGLRIKICNEEILSNYLAHPRS